MVSSETKKTEEQLPEAQESRTEKKKTSAKTTKTVKKQSAKTEKKTAAKTTAKRPAKTTKKTAKGSEQKTAAPAAADEQAPAEKKPLRRRKTAAEAESAAPAKTLKTEKSETIKKKTAKAPSGAAAAGKTLVVVESPTKARTLTKILGSRYTVKASVGHIMDLPKSRLGIDVEDHFRPEYILVKGKAPIKKELLSAAKNAKKVLLAADPDREGEAIAWHVAELLGVDPASDCRVLFHEITPTAVKGAVREPQPINMDRVNAQQARRVIDRLAGYGMSPLLWAKIRRGLSAGRVQSAALAIICEREEIIENFKPVSYWNIFADALAEDGRAYRLQVQREKGKNLLVEEGKTIVGVTDPGKVKKIEATLKTDPMTVSAFVMKKNSRKAPAPFKTSTLQQLASSRLGFGPRKTMTIAQSLFEGVSLPGRGTVGLITYMRTDSLRMAPEALNQARGLIQTLYGGAYLPEKPLIYQAGANAQDAHEAIRPTDFSLTPESLRAALTPEQFRLYDLIWRRSMASQMSPAVVSLSTLDCACGDYGLRAQGSSVDFDGWGRVWPMDMKNSLLEPARQGESLAVQHVKTEEDQTKPPARYTESTLIKTMEDDGIGRPSTYASTVETLSSRFYVERDEERRLKPTALGRTVNTFLQRHFDKNSPSPIVDVNFTSSMESSLDQVEDGKKDWLELVAQFWDPFQKAVELARQSPDMARPADVETGESCPQCGRPLVIKHGRFGEFVGCSGYPECRYVKPKHVKTGVSCPKCGKEHGGEVIQRKSKTGRTFFGCSRYPECDYVAWNRPTDQICPVCGSVMELPPRAKKPVCPQCGRKKKEKK